MKPFCALLGLELRKIVWRKSTWIILGAMIVIYLLFVSSSYWVTYGMADEASTVSSNMEEEPWEETAAQKLAREKQNGLLLSGKKLDDTLLKEREQYENQMIKNWQKLSAKEKSLQIERYTLVKYAISAATGRSLESVINYINQMDEKQIYEEREQLILETQNQYRLTDSEVKYWNQKEEQIEKPFVLQYMGMFESLVGNEIYLSLLLLTFWIAIIVSRIFSEEHSKKTDQLILSSRYGRKHLYFAKIAAGTITTFLASVVIIGMVVLANGIIYGTDGFSTMVQQIAGWYSYPFTLGEIACIMIGIELVAVLLTAVVTMIVSEKFCSSISAIAVIIGIMFIGRLIEIPKAYRVLSQLWNYIPINLLNINGFLDIRLFSVGKLQLTAWQFAPILYVIIGVVFIVIGKRIYCNYQVR